jgi:ATP-binding cassette, subfamily B, bacterial
VELPGTADMARKTLQTYWKFAKVYPRYVWGMLALLPVTLLVHQFLPQLVIATMLNKLSTGQYRHDDLWGSFGWMLVAYAVLRMSSATYIWRWVIILLDKLEANVLRDIANHVFSHLLSQSQQFHANRFSGTLVAQTTKFMSAYVRLAEATVMQFLPLVLSFCFTAIILWPKAPYFVVMLLVFCLAYMVITARGTNKIRLLSNQDAESQSKQTGQLADALSNILTVKSFAATAKEQERFYQATQQTRQKTLAYMKLNNSRQLYFSTLTSSITSCSVALAVASVVLFDANIAVAFLVLDYSANIVAKLWQFSSSTLRDVNRAFGESADMVTILGLQPDIADPDHPEQSHIKKGAVAFTDITFRHPESGNDLFHAFNVTIAAGEKIGLVGPSGAGKTTLTKLILRFADISKGHITIDGQSIAAITQQDLHTAIAYVPQEPLLFHRSIRENIAYGRSGASQKAVVAAAKKAHAHEFITALPQGYDTLVGERGVKLSGGQRQRIAIARAIIKDAPILILDEATSALDSESEIRIQESLQSLMQHRTTIVVAHRLSTIQKMDRIIVLDKGRIVEQGTHQSLLRHKGVYAKLWKHQSGGFITE